MKSFRIKYSLILLLFVSSTFAADKKDMTQALAQLKILTQLNVYSYDYTVKNTYPDTKTDLASGRVNIDLIKKALFEKGTYSTTLLNDQWYYKAEHNVKTVHIVDLNNYYKKNPNAMRLDAFFDSKTMLVPDSIFQQYGTLERFEIKNNIVSIRFKFNQLMNMDTYEIIFDRKKAIPISIFIKTYAPSHRGITYQEFKGFNFKKELPSACFSISTLFDIKVNKVILKMYNNYKPHFEL